MLLLGIADIIAGSLLIRELYNIPVPQVIIIVFGVYLIMKGLLFISDFGSMMDLLAGILLILTIFFNLPVFILIVFASLLGIKGALSLFTGIF